MQMKYDKTMIIKEKITLGAILNALRHEGYSKLQIISKGGQGITFRYVCSEQELENVYLCIKVFFQAKTAKAEYNTWSQVYNKCSNQRYLLYIVSTILELNIDGTALNYFLMVYYPYTLRSAMQHGYVRYHALRLFRQICIGV